MRKRKAQPPWQRRQSLDCAIENSWQTRESRAKLLVPRVRAPNNSRVANDVGATVRWRGSKWKSEKGRRISPGNWFLSNYPSLYVLFSPFHLFSSTLQIPHTPGWQVHRFLVSSPRTSPELSLVDSNYLLAVPFPISCRSVHPPPSYQWLSGPSDGEFSLSGTPLTGAPLEHLYTFTTLIMKGVSRVAICASVLLLFSLYLLEAHLQDLYNQYRAGAYLVDWLDRNGPVHNAVSGVTTPGDNVIVMAKLEEEDTTWVEEELPECVPVPSYIPWVEQT